MRAWKRFIKLSPKYRVISILISLWVAYSIWHWVSVFIIGYSPPCPDSVRLGDSSSLLRPVLSATMTVNHLWDFQPSWISEGSIVASDRRVVFGDAGCDRVIAINGESGDFDWRYSIGRPDHLEFDKSRNRIIVAGISPPQLASLSLDGERHWLNDSQRGERGGLVPDVFSDGRLFASAAPGFVTVDPDTGEFSPAITLPDTLYPLSEFTVGDQYFWRITGSRLEARTVPDGELAWKADNVGFLECPFCLHQIIVVDEWIVGYAGSEVFVLNAETGAIGWYYTRTSVVSNIVVLGDNVLFLDVDAKLHIHNIADGQRGTVQFAYPTNAARRENNSVDMIGSSMLATTDDLVFIYFGDTNILSAFRVEFP